MPDEPYNPSPIGNPSVLARRNWWQTMLVKFIGKHTPKCREMVRILSQSMDEPLPLDDADQETPALFDLLLVPALRRTAPLHAPYRTRVSRARGRSLGCAVFSRSAGTYQAEAGGKRSLGPTGCKESQPLSTNGA